MNYDILNQYIGKTIKSYKELCVLLEEEILAGNAKKAQIKKWERHFRFHNDGYKIIIDEIYNVPKKMIDKRKDKLKVGNNSVYTKLIEYLIACNLMTATDNTGTYTKTKLCQKLGMVNNNYIRFKNSRYNSLLDIYDIEEKLEAVSSWQTDHFVSKTDQKISEILFTSLNSMQRRKMLLYSEEYSIAQTNEGGELFYRFANEEEKKSILIIQQEALRGMGLDRVPFSQLQIKEYFKRINRAINELYGWEFVFVEYKIIYNPDYFPYVLPKLKRELNSMSQKYSIKLNKKLIDTMTKQAQNLYEQNKNRINKEEGRFVYPNIYLENQKVLIETFIKI